MKRRDFLKGSAAFAGATAAGFSCVEFAAATPIQMPVVDKLSVRMIVDINTNFFLKPQFLNGVSMVPANRSKDYTRTLHSEFGLSLLLESAMESQTHTIMLDYAYTPATLLSNFDYLGLDPGKIDALVVSHGHFDHYGALIAFLDKYRGALPSDVKLYAGGEDNFCHRVLPTGTPGAFTDFGYLDRRRSRHAKSRSCCAKTRRLLVAMPLRPVRSSAVPTKKFCPIRWSNSVSRTGSAATLVTMHLSSCWERPSRTSTITSTPRSLT
jgi:7,8-dihydropterin-6-yl-methyl-4-(beta-D-ribofuranosyl)aminobenzene 5'-phosphate synthase